MSKPIITLPGPGAYRSSFFRPITLNRVKAAQTLLLDLADFLTTKGQLTPLLDAGELLHHWLSTPVCELLANTDHEQFRSVCDLINTLAKAAATNRVVVVNITGSVEVWEGRSNG